MGVTTCARHASRTRGQKGGAEDTCDCDSGGTGAATTRAKPMGEGGEKEVERQHVPCGEPRFEEPRVESTDDEMSS